MFLSRIKLLGICFLLLAFASGSWTEEASSREEMTRTAEAQDRGHYAEAEKSLLAALKIAESTKDGARFAIPTLNTPGCTSRRAATIEPNRSSNEPWLF
jgi:hypothetical protein